jgi:catechol 2,3-dioxygenase-like lactoylglutathione lyase family enzyme
MQDIDNSTTLGASALALLALAEGNTAGAAESDTPPLSVVPNQKEIPKPAETNPYAVRVLGSTLVTPDMEASMHFYRDVMGYEIFQRGKLEDHLPTVPGVGAPGRFYALVRSREPEWQDKGVIRILEAPPGAKANRPRPTATTPGATIMDTGFAALEALTRDDDESYRKILEAKIPVVSPPLFYHQDGVKPEPGAPVTWDSGDIEVTTYSGFGPAGEQFFVTRIITLGGKRAPAWKQASLHDPLAGCVLLTRDRWPLFEFYNKVFGLKPSKVQFLQQEMVNQCIGAPKGTYYYFGSLGEGMGFEWWEYRSVKPEPTPPFPTSLDRTGWAMFTLVVNDLPGIKERAKKAGIPILGEGALPTPDALHQDGFYVRGVLGELVEVIGRKA